MRATVSCKVLKGISVPCSMGKQGCAQMIKQGGAQVAKQGYAQGANLCQRLRSALPRRICALPAGAAPAACSLPARVMAPAPSPSARVPGVHEGTACLLPAAPALERSSRPLGGSMRRMVPPLASAAAPRPPARVSC